MHGVFSHCDYSFLLPFYFLLCYFCLYEEESKRIASRSDFVLTFLRESMKPPEITLGLKVSVKFRIGITKCGSRNLK
jgi:hypothetical protein